MIIDGRTLAQEVLARAKARAERLPHSPRVLGIVANETPATLSYLSIKGKRATDAGCIFDVQKFPEETNAISLREAIASSDADAIIVQLPLPNGIDARAVCDAIPTEKDADALSIAARTKFERGDADALLPPVVAAVREIFMQGNVEVKGKHAVVIGNGWLVGNPCAAWLTQQGATVSVLTSQSGNLFDGALPAGRQVRAADIIISGTGSPHLIKPDMLKEGVVLIDAGTSESGGALAGDADPACAEKCSLFTPVPGGVGPIAVACLFENAVSLAERAMNS